MVRREEVGPHGGPPAARKVDARADGGLVVELDPETLPQQHAVDEAL
jgi:hypothetical protein